MLKSRYCCVDLLGRAGVFVAQMVRLFLYSTLADAGELTPRGSNAAILGGYMRDGTKLNTRAIFLKASIVAGMSLIVWLTGCSSPKPARQAPRRYSLNGRVVSVEKAKQQVVVDHGEITGFMMAMTMGYSVKNPNLLDSLSPEDQITADVVVNGDDVWLENIVVVKKADRAKAPASNETHPASPQPKKQ
jgi:protein SCO1/2